VDFNPAGYFELVRLDDGGWEVNYLGILPDFQGQGLGRHVLSTAVAMCFNKGARRVQLDTCTLDHPAAIRLYENTGFVPYKTERYLRSLPEREDQSEWIKAASCQEIMLAAV
jgi:ribosomal protein S18 acetylase RimI-like enzyme